MICQVSLHFIGDKFDIQFDNVFHDEFGNIRNMNMSVQDVVKLSAVIVELFQIRQRIRHLALPLPGLKMPSNQWQIEYAICWDTLMHQLGDTINWVKWFSAL